MNINSSPAGLETASSDYYSGAKGKRKRNINQSVQTHITPQEYEYFLKE